MARIKLDTLKKNDKDRNTVHTPVATTYTVFEELGIDIPDGEWQYDYWMINNRTKGCGLIAFVNHW